MAYEKKEVNWDAKECREQFCKSANSQIINGKTEITKILETAQTIVDRAWELYPSGNDKKDDKVEKDNYNMPAE